MSYEIKTLYLLMLKDKLKVYGNTNIAINYYYWYFIKSAVSISLSKRK